MGVITETPTAGMTRAEWLQERRGSLGGSDMGAVLGLNPHSSPVAVWANKTGRIADAEPSEAMRQGTDLEEYVAQRFCELSGWKVRRKNAIIRNSDYKHIHANVDRLVVGQHAGLECKTSSAFGGGRFGQEDFPAHYYAQCLTYMAVTGLPTWYLAVLVLGISFKVYCLTTTDMAKPGWCESITRVDPVEFDYIREGAEGFWECVESDTMPAADGSDSCSDAIAEMYPRANDSETVDLSFQCGNIHKLLELQDVRASIDKDIDAIKNEIKLDMKTAACARCGNNTITFREQTRRTLDRKALAKAHPELDLNDFMKSTTTRVFRIKEEE